MRQLYLAILIITGICIAGMPHREFQNSFRNGKTFDTSQFSAATNDLPFGDHEILQPGFFSGHGCRQQHTDVLTEHRSIEHVSGQYDKSENGGLALLNAPKNYLSHIYPSHNFW